MNHPHSFKRGQRVIYTAARWNGARFEFVERGAKVVQLDGSMVRLLTDHDNCRVWFRATTVKAAQ